MTLTREEICWGFGLVLGREPQEPGYAAYAELNSRSILISKLLQSEEAISKEKGNNFADILHQTKQCFSLPELNRTIVLGKSMPRSGHHFLEKLLSSYFANEITYCEMYGEKKCCKLYPCANPYNSIGRYHFQKSHDWSFDDRRTINCPYVIQYRSPVSRAQSNYELHLRSSCAQDSSKEFQKFLHREAEYFIKFYNKWMTPNMPNSILVNYMDLVSDPKGELFRIIKFIGENEIDITRLDKAINSNNAKVNTLNSPVGIRKSCEFRHFDKILYREIEAHIAAKCPNIDDVLFEYQY